MRFDNRTVIITGAAGNLGNAVAKAFADRGADLVLVDLKEENLASTFGAQNDHRLFAPANLLEAGGAATVAARPTGATLLQLGVFETRANALRLRDRLPAEFGTAQVDEVQRGNRRFFRVSLGPFASADAAADFARQRLTPHGFEWRVVTAESP